jgi:hypothetical protein
MTDVVIPTAEELEKELIQRAKDNANDPMEMAAKTYHLQLQRFKSLQHLLKSGRSKMRLLNLIMEYPLNDAKLKAHTPVEQDLALLANSVLEAKFVLIMLNYQANFDQLAAADNAPLTDVVIDDSLKPEETTGE